MYAHKYVRLVRSIFKAISMNHHYIVIWYTPTCYGGYIPLFAYASICVSGNASPECNHTDIPLGE